MAGSDRRWNWSALGLAIVLVAAGTLAWHFLTGGGSGPGPVSNVMEHSLLAARIESLEDLDPPLRAALEEAARRLEENPASAERWGRLGMLFQSHGFHLEASRAYRRAAGLDPKDARWPHLLGIEYELLPLPDEAALAYERAIELDDRDLVALSSWARILQDRGQDDQARRLYLRALEIDRNAVAPRVGLGQLAARAGEEDIAERSFQLAVEAFPRCGPAHSALARIYSRRGDESRATFHRRWSLALPGKLPLPDPLMDEVQELGVSYVARMKRAELAVRRGQLPLGAEHYRAAASLRPGLAEPRYRLGATLLRSGKAGEAIEHLRAATQLQGDAWRIDAYVQLAVVHAERRSFTEAERMIDEALEIEPDEPRVLVQRGKLFFLQRRNEDALAAFENAISLHPEHAEAYLEKGALLLLMSKGTESENLPPDVQRERSCSKTREALAALEKALARDVDLAAAYDLAGSARMVLRADCEQEARERARLLTEAIDRFSSLVRYFPSRGKGYLHLIRALRAAGDHERASAYLREARVRWPEDARFKGLRTRAGRRDG